jgi:hypothetical protein
MLCRPAWHGNVNESTIFTSESHVVYAYIYIYIYIYIWNTVFLNTASNFKISKILFNWLEQTELKPAFYAICFVEKIAFFLPLYKSQRLQPHSVVYFE